MLPQGSWQIKDLNLKATGLKWDLVPVPHAPRTRRNGSTNRMASVAIDRTSRARGTPSGAGSGSSAPGRAGRKRQSPAPSTSPPAHRQRRAALLRPPAGPGEPPPPARRAEGDPGPPLAERGGQDRWSGGRSPTLWIDQIFEGQLGVKDGAQQLHDQLNAAIDRGFK